MSDSHSSDPIGRPLRAALELFEDALSEVRFPDVSAELLRSKAAAVAARADALRAAHEALADAEAALAAERAGLAELAGKALAYARIYAEGRPEIAQRLAAVELTEVGSDAKRRGRPRKRASGETGAMDALPPALPFESPADEAPNGLGALG